MRKLTYASAVGMLWLLTSGPVYAEMHKGGSMAPIIWGTFLITAVIPVIIGLVICWLFKLIVRKRPKRTATVLAALVSWWFGIHIAMQDRGPGQDFNEWWIVLWTVIVSIGMAYLSTVFTEPADKSE